MCTTLGESTPKPPWVWGQGSVSQVARLLWFLPEERWVLMPVVVSQHLQLSLPMPDPQRITAFIKGMSHWGLVGLRVHPELRGSTQGEGSTQGKGPTHPMEPGAMPPLSTRCQAWLCSVQPPAAESWAWGPTFVSKLSAHLLL